MSRRWLQHLVVAFVANCDAGVGRVSRLARRLVGNCDVYERFEAIGNRSVATRRHE